MNTATRLLLAFLFVGLVAAALLINSTSRQFIADASYPVRHGMIRESNVLLQVRDGIFLASEIYKPLEGGPYPVILIRTTYGGYNFQAIQNFVFNDYIVMVQDVRGRFDSEGHYENPHSYSRSDGYDTLDWIIRQPWATDKVGVFGCSYPGEAGLILTATQHPNLAAAIVEGAGGAIGNANDSFGYFGVFENGVLNLASSVGWFSVDGLRDTKAPIEPPAEIAGILQQAHYVLPVASIQDEITSSGTGLDDILRFSLDDEWWLGEGYIHDQDQFTTPTLHINTWYDQTIHDSFRVSRFMRDQSANTAAENQPLVVGPGTHCSSGDYEEGRINIGQMPLEYNDLDYDQLYLDWFDFWLKGEGENQLPDYQYFLIHANQWEQSNSWPPQQIRDSEYFLAANGAIVVESGAMTLAQSSTPFLEFDYDPANPVLTIGGTICCTYDGNDPGGPFLQDINEQRQDILTFQSSPLPEDRDLIGNVRVRLSVSSSARDTDFTAKLIDIFPDGSAFNLHDGIVRMRYRDGIETSSFLSPGEIYEIELELRPIAYRFLQDHRIGLQLSSSNFPRLARNLNTGDHEYLDDDIEIATNRIHFSQENPSSLVLPLRPTSD